MNLDKPELFELPAKFKKSCFVRGQFAQHRLARALEQDQIECQTQIRVVGERRFGLGSERFRSSTSPLRGAKKISNIDAGGIAHLVEPVEREVSL